MLGVKQSCLHRAFVLLGIQLGLSQTRLCRPSLWMAWKKTAGALCCLGGLDAFSTESHLRVHAANLRLLDVHTEQPHDGTFDPSVRRRRETHCNHRWQKKEENRRPRKIDKVRGTMARKRCVCVLAHHPCSSGHQFKMQLGDAAAHLRGSSSSCTYRAKRRPCSTPRTTLAAYYGCMFQEVRVQIRRKEPAVRPARSTY